MRKLMTAHQSSCCNSASRGVWGTITLLMLSLLLPACVETELNLVPGLSTTREGSKTRALMQELAVSISAIEDAGVSSTDTDTERDIIISELDRISKLVTELEREDVVQGTEQFDGSHEFVLEYLNTLASEVELAKAQVGDEHADLFIAGQLAGACRGCHDRLWPDN